MTYEVTLQHTVDDKVVSTKSCIVDADDENAACRCALEVASSLQGGMFRVMTRGKHQLDVIKVERVK